MLHLDRSRVLTASRCRVRKGLAVGLVVVACLSLAAPGRAYLPVIEGNCGDLDTELTDASPHLLSTLVDVLACYFIPGALSPEALAIYNSNPGSSVWSEILAYQLLAQCDGADLLKTKDQIVYLDAGGVKTDALLSFGGTKIGLKVSRGMIYPLGTPMTPAQAQLQLERALDKVNLSSANVGPEDAWQKQILMIATLTSLDRDNFIAAYALVDAARKADTIVWIVQTGRECVFIYDGGNPVCLGTAVGDDNQRAPMLAQNCPNPFNPRTTIRFDLPDAGSVRLAVYDVAGRLLRVLAGGEMAAGRHEAVWDGRDASGRAMASGSYFARLEAGGKVETVRMSLVR